MRARLVAISVTLATVSITMGAPPSHGLLHVPEYVECTARRVTLSFEPDARGDRPASVRVSTERTKRRLAYAALTFARVSERCHAFTFGRRPRNYHVKRKVRGRTRIECSVHGSAVRVQIGDYAEPVAGASTERGVVLATRTRDLAGAIIGERPQLTYDATVCREQPLPRD